MRMLGLLALLAPALLVGMFRTSALPDRQPPAQGERLYSEIESRLAPLAKKLRPPRPGEWLFEHKESGQTFEQYLSARPVRRGQPLATIYLCLLGDFTPPQRRVVELTRVYMEVFFDTPVKFHGRVPLKDVPTRARRTHPRWGDPQILSTYVLDEVLLPERPKDALAYLAFTASDLWPGEGWNFVFGQASPRQRTGVWSIYRHGDPSKGAAAFRRCLRRTLGTATHETGHILTMEHCAVYECSLNGCNSLEEADRKPLRLCPICLRKHCWNLRLEPVAYLGRLKKFYRQRGFPDEADWCAKAAAILGKARER